MSASQLAGRLAPASVCGFPPATLSTFQSLSLRPYKRYTDIYCWSSSKPKHDVTRMKVFSGPFLAISVARQFRRHWTTFRLRDRHEFNGLYYSGALHTERESTSGITRGHSCIHHQALPIEVRRYDLVILEANEVSRSPIRMSNSKNCRGRAFCLSGVLNETAIT